MKGDSYFIGNYYFGLNDPWETFFLMAVLNEGDVFCDIGANQGHYSMLVGKFAECRVDAFEPAARARDRLLDNLKMNKGMDKLEVYPLAVGNSDERMSLTGDLGSMNKIVQEGQDQNASDVVVDMIRLDSFYASKTAPLAIKLDIEGYEYFALQGAEKLLTSETCQCLLVELNSSGVHYGIEDSSIVEYLREKGFRPCIFDLNEWSLKAIPGKWPNGYNTLFVKDAERINDRLKKKRIYFKSRRKLIVERRA